MMLRFVRYDADWCTSWQALCCPRFCCTDVLGCFKLTVLLYRLFQTLDPMLRQAVLQSGRQVILSDTVGFIDNLPPSLIKAFQVCTNAC